MWQWKFATDACLSLVPGLWRLYEDACFEDRVELLCCTPPDPQYTSVCFQAGDAVHGGVAGSGSNN